MPADLVIRNARVIDGTGMPWFRADVAVQGDRIVQVGAYGAQAATEIDAAGRVACPGFIDVHCHSELQLLAHPDHDPKVRQGVTTEVLGVDGISYAPLSAENLATMKLYWGGINGTPDVGWDWTDIDSFLRKFDRKVSVNVAMLAPHGCLRAEVIGFANRRATPAELEQMGTILARAFDQGAVGLSTGLDYQPCSYADTEELVALCAVTAKYGRPFVTHLRYKLGDRFLDPVRETIEIGERSGAQVHVSHFSASSKHVGGAEELLAMVDGARKEGVDFTFDSYPYAAGSTGLFITFPDWAHDGGPEQLLRRIAGGPERRRLLEDLREPEGPYALWPGDITRLAYVASDKNRWMEGLFLAEVAQKVGKDLPELVLDLLVEERLQLSAVIMFGSEPSLREMMRHPAQMCSTDALLVGGCPHPRAYGTYPRYLGRYVRELGILRLEDAVRRMTSAPATRFGLADRGILRPGMAADIVIFDPDTVIDKATFDQPRQFPAGIDHVIVNGVPVIANGKHSHTRPGRALRRS